VNQRHTVIIGNGIAGITTARELRKRSPERITIISDESPYFYSRTALMYVYMGKINLAGTEPYERSFWKKNRIELMQARVSGISVKDKTLHTTNGKTLEFDRLVLATGSKRNTPAIKGTEIPGVQGLYSLNDLETLEANTHPPLVAIDKRKVKSAVLIGGGLIGVELAEMLYSRGIDVTFLVREKGYWGDVLPEADSAFICEHIRSFGCTVLTETEASEILADANGRACAVRTKSGSDIECQLAGLTAGVVPNVAFLHNSELETDKGILTDEFLRTNITDIYAAGDCVQFRQPASGRRAIEQTWYTGRMMGECLGRTLGGEPTAYKPGPWFNSAKFFSMEFQTYGRVPVTPDSNEVLFHWEETDPKRALTLAWQTDTLRFSGINAFGIRLRHEVMDALLRSEADIRTVIASLDRANFDSEFSHTWIRHFVSRFRETFPAFNV
jgi:3-phenylpropionate/trans-cinnamate dioxygenase ferredoxin reductase component